MTNLNRYQYDKYMTSWLSGAVHEYVRAHRGEYETDEFFLSKNCFFVTAIFDHKMIRRSALCNEEHLAAGQQEWKRFRHLYNLTCRNMLGANYHRKRDEAKPLCIAGLDADGSRYWRQTGEIKNLHVHAIWIMPTTGDAALFEAQESILSQPNSQFREIDIRRYRNIPDGRSLETLISYATKFSKFNWEEAEVKDDILIFPMERNAARLAA